MFELSNKKIHRIMGWQVDLVVGTVRASQFQMAKIISSMFTSKLVIILHYSVFRTDVGATLRTMNSNEGLKMFLKVNKYVL